MTPFMTEDFLLDTEFARRLYHDYAKDQPIFDYTAIYRRSSCRKLSLQKPV